jgi:hypothetical protein
MEYGPVRDAFTRQQLYAKSAIAFTTPIRRHHGLNVNLQSENMKKVNITTVAPDTTVNTDDAISGSSV